VRIGLLSDVHGNMTALRAVLADAQHHGVTEYWLLGDTIMPGPGTTDLLDLLHNTNVTHFIRGNWEDCLTRAVVGDTDLDRPTNVYLARLAAYTYEHIGDAGVATVTAWPLTATTTIGPLKTLICHNLPDMNWGTRLMRMSPQENFDEIFRDNNADLAVIGHTHSPFLRYGTHGQMIVNPGSVGQSPHFDAGPAHDLRARYAILDVDDMGTASIIFRRVDYDRDAEIALATAAGLPYLDLYIESLTAGRTHQHDRELLRDLNARLGYNDDVARFLGRP